MCARQLQAFCVGSDRSSTSRTPGIRHWVAAGVAGLSLALPLSGAAAQAAEHDDGLPKALLLRTAVQRGKPAPELDKQIHKTVVEQAPVHLREHPPKRLSALQASVGCHDESVVCMRAVAHAADVEVLVAATLERGASELTLTFMAFDARADAITRVAHWQDGSDVTSETYAALPSLVGALFPEPGPPDMDFVAEANAASEARASRAGSVAAKDAGAAPRSLTAPILVAGGGALLLGAGVVTGLVLSSTQSDYTDRDVRTRADAEEADALRARASTQATMANVFFGLGSVALAASGAWLAIELLSGRKDQRPATAPTTTLAPWVSSRELGLVLRHQGGAL